MIVFYLLLLILTVVILASIIPIGQYVYSLVKREKSDYRFSEQLFNREYKDIPSQHTMRYSPVVCKDFSSMKELEYSIELL